LSGSDNIFERANAGDIIAQRLLVLANLESVPVDKPVAVERIEVALHWARAARAGGDGEDAMRLFWTLVRRIQYDDALTDDRLTERLAGEAVAALAHAATRDDGYGAAARNMLPESVCAMRAGAVFHTRLFLRAWSIPADSFEAVLQIATTPADDQGVGQMPSAELLANASACGVLASKVAERFDIACDDAIPLVANAPDALEKLKTPDGWHEIADQIGERLGAAAAPNMSVTVN
jgi:hypothetical protein